MSPQVVWFTLPGANSLGSLTVTSGGSKVVTFPIPTPASQPYDIACAGGLVWLTERAGNKIASFSSVTLEWTEYSIPTPRSEPTGIDVQAGDPIEVWFTERTGNRIGRLSVPSRGPYELQEYAAPFSGMQLEDIALAGPGYAWFTAPGTHQIGRFNLSLWPGSDAFVTPYTGAASQPWNIATGAGNPWFTDRTGSRIGQFTPGTMTNITWHPTPTANSDPYAIGTMAGRVWFTELAGQRAGRLDPSADTVLELRFPGAAMTSLSFDNDTCAWLADSAQNQLLRWCSPYFRSIYLPRIMR